MKTRRFDFNWRPLQLQVSMSVEGSVPGHQNYNALTGEYTPDYSLTPLTIQPIVSVIDKDGVIPSGKVNAQITNVRWYELVSFSERELIADDNPNYEIRRSGEFKGRIVVKNNQAGPDFPVTLEFYAEYVDRRNGQILVARGTYQIVVRNAADDIRVELDAADQTVYNPLADPDLQTVRARVWSGERLATSGFTLHWDVEDEDGEWRYVDAVDVLGYDVSAEGDTAVVDRRLMGRELHLRCWVSTPYTSIEDAPSAEAVFVRRVPAFEFDFTGVPYNLPSGTKEVAPEAVVRTTKGDLANWERELLPLWYVAPNKASGSLEYGQAGLGRRPVIPTEAMSQGLGAVIGLEVKDRGPLCAWTDGTDGAVICLGTGEVTLIR